MSETPTCSKCHRKHEPDYEYDGVGILHKVAQPSQIACLQEQIEHLQADRDNLVNVLESHKAELDRLKAELHLVAAASKLIADHLALTDAIATHTKDGERL